MRVTTDVGHFRVAALIVGEPRGMELWTLRGISSIPCELHVVQALQGTTVPRLKRASSLIKRNGLFSTASRVMGKWLIGARDEKRDCQELDELLDVRTLQEWWECSGLVPLKVSQLNHEESRLAIAKIAPDVIVRVSGGILKPHMFRLAKLATLNIHHGRAPLIRGVWSIPWGIVEGRRDWIGATVHLIDEGIDTGLVLSRHAPQLAPGETAVDLFFRSHLEAVDALVRILDHYAKGRTPEPLTRPDNESSSYRSSPDLWVWLRFLWLGRGRRARVLWERAIEC